MKKLALILCLLFLFGTVFSLNPASYNGLNKGNSSSFHLYLFEKDPVSEEIIEDGAWGKLTFSTKNNNFNLTAHKLEPETEYALINYYGLDFWPNAKILVRGYTDKKGNLKFSGEWPLWSMKFWVVKGEDIEGESGVFGSGAFVAWNPSEYLFEYWEI